VIHQQQKFEKRFNIRRAEGIIPSVPSFGRVQRPTLKTRAAMEDSFLPASSSKTSSAQSHAHLGPE